MCVCVCVCLWVQFGSSNARYRTIAYENTGIHIHEVASRELAGPEKCASHILTSGICVRICSLMSLMRILRRARLRARLKTTRLKNTKVVILQVQ